MRYTVELRLPRTGWEDLQEAAARARQATEQMRLEGEHVRFLRSIFVPDDETCFLLIEASSADAVRDAAELASLPYERVTAVAATT